MAIDMTTIKAISYNNKDVVKIEDSNANVLWQKKTPTTTNVNVPLSQIATISVGSNTYTSIKFNTGYANTITNYIATSLGISTSDIISQTLGSLRLNCNTVSTAQRYEAIYLSTATSSSNVDANLKWSNSDIYVASAGSRINVTLYKKSGMNISDIGTSKIYHWNSGKYARAYNTTSNVEIYMDSNTLNNSNSYLTISVEYYA